MLNAAANEFFPAAVHRHRKTKDERTRPRRRRRKNHNEISTALTDCDNPSYEQLYAINRESRESPVTPNSSSYSWLLDTPKVSPSDTMQEFSVGDTTWDHTSYHSPEATDYYPSLPPISGPSLVDGLDGDGIDFIAEEQHERRKWTAWAINASEVERQRRIAVLKALEAEQDNERAARRQWAIESWQREQSARISRQFFVNIHSSQWFHDAMSSYNDDYELVCPYYRLGCRIKCLRSTVSAHLSNCVFALESKSSDDVVRILDQVKALEYEVVCPNSVLGCKYTGTRKDIQHHLASCQHRGQTVEQEIKERMLLKQQIILECEEERARRLSERSMALPTSLHGQKSWSSPRSPVPRRISLDGAHISLDVAATSNNNKNAAGVGSIEIGGTSASRDSVETSAYDADSGGGSQAGLHLLFRQQTDAVLSSLHDEIRHVWVRERTFMEQAVEPAVGMLVSKLQVVVASLWSFARVEVFGSYSTGIGGRNKDLDLMVCFSDQWQSFLSIHGALPLLHVLASHLERNASDIISLKTVILHARVPIIKATAVLQLASVDGEDQSELQLAIDISIDGPRNTGLATSAMLTTLASSLQPLAPVAMVLKQYLRANGLYESFNGGLSGYGLVLLLLLPLFSVVLTNERTSTDASDNSLPAIADIVGSKSCIGCEEKISVRSGRDSGSRSGTPSPSSSPSVIPASLQSPPPTRPIRMSAALQHSRASPVPTADIMVTPAPRLNHITDIGKPKVVVYSIKTAPLTWSALTAKRQLGTRIAIQLLKELQKKSASDVKNSVFVPIDIQSLRSDLDVSEKSMPSSSPSGIPMNANTHIMRPSSNSAPASRADTPVSATPTLGSEEREDFSRSHCNYPSPVAPSITLTSDRPIYGLILEQFLYHFGEEMICGKHGYSFRDGGFRFDVHGGAGVPSHPQHLDPLLIEDPINVMNNVARNCFKASSVQKSFLEAHDKLKALIVRNPYQSRRRAAATLTSVDVLLIAPPSLIASSSSRMLSQEVLISPPETPASAQETVSPFSPLSATVSDDVDVAFNGSKHSGNSSTIKSLVAKFERHTAAAASRRSGMKEIGPTLPRPLLAVRTGSVLDTPTTAAAVRSDFDVHIRNAEESNSVARSSYFLLSEIFSCDFDVAKRMT